MPIRTMQPLRKFPSLIWGCQIRAVQLEDPRPLSEAFFEWRSGIRQQTYGHRAEFSIAGQRGCPITTTKTQSGPQSLKTKGHCRLQKVLVRASRRTVGIGPLHWAGQARKQHPQPTPAVDEDSIRVRAIEGGKAQQRPGVARVSAKPTLLKRALEGSPTHRKVD